MRLPSRPMRARACACVYAHVHWNRRSAPLLWLRAGPLLTYLARAHHSSKPSIGGSKEALSGSLTIPVRRASYPLSSLIHTLSLCPHACTTEGTHTRPVSLPSFHSASYHCASWVYSLSGTSHIGSGAFKTPWLVTTRLTLPHPRVTTLEGLTDLRRLWQTQSFLNDRCKNMVNKKHANAKHLV